MAQSSFARGKRSNAPIFIAALFALMIVITFAFGRMPLIVPAVYLAASAITFITYGIDKSAAQGNRWRIQESTLHFFALACGWPGALAAQYMLRHKSKKESFLSVFWATAALNFGALCWLTWAQSATALRSAIGF